MHIPVHFQLPPRPRCTKLQLLFLLGHLNLAIRIIPQGRSYISHLLSLSAAIPSLLDHITLDHQCKMELRMWRMWISFCPGTAFLSFTTTTSPNQKTSSSTPTQHHQLASEAITAADGLHPLGPQNFLHSALPPPSANSTQS